MPQARHHNLRSLLGVGLVVGLTLLMVAKGWPSRHNPASGDRAAAAIAYSLATTENLSLPGMIEIVAAARDRRAPYGYIFTIWMLAKLSPYFSKELGCLVAPARECAARPDLRFLYQTQLMVALACVLASYLLIYLICGRHEAAHLGIAIILMVSRFSAAARSLHGDMLMFTLLVLLHWCAALAAIRRKSAMLGALAGALLGLACLFHVTAALLAPLLLVALSLGAWRQSGAAGACVTAVAVCVGLAVAILPASLLNQAAYGDPIMTTGTLVTYLSQRAAFNDMTSVQFGASLVYWLPLVGKPIAGLLWPVNVIESLEALSPGSLKYIGMHQIELRAKSVGRDTAALWWLVDTYVTGDARRYAVTTIPLLLRGVWKAGDVFALLALALLPLSLRIAKRRRELLGYTYVLASGAFILIFHALLAPGYWWLSMPTVVLAPLVISYVMQGI